MIFDYKREDERGLVSFKTPKPLVFIRHSGATFRPWTVYVLSIDDWIEYGEAWYYVNHLRSYPKARQNYNSEMDAFGNYSEFNEWPCR